MLIRFALNHRSELLMSAYVALILASPAADANPHLGGIIAFLVLLVMLAGASYMANKRIIRLAALPMAGLWIAARILEAVGDPRQPYTQLAPIAGLGLSCVILWAILDRFDSIARITIGVISEAFICYLVLATAFSQVYCILNRFLDHAFNQVIPASQTSTFLYFSIITLSTVGYGGITPANPYVRLVAGLEGMIGVFYIAVIVARLVAAYDPRRKTQAIAPGTATAFVQVHPGDPDAQAICNDVPLVGSSAPK